MPFVRAALGTLGGLCCRVTEAQVRREAAGGDVPASAGRSDGFAAQLAGSGPASCLYYFLFLFPLASEEQPRV